jgi:signal transduction histidine kinase
VAPQQRREELFDWPPWVPGVFTMLALVSGVVVIAQRAVAGRAMGAGVAFATLVLLPFVLEIVSAIFRRRFVLPKLLFPVPVLAGMAVLLANVDEAHFAPFVLVMVCAQMAAESEDRPLFGVLVTFAACAEMVLFDIFGPHDDSFVWVIGISFGWFGGFSVQTLANQTFALRRANAELAEKVATEERQRIAREIHDVIAHSLSVTMLHVTAARMALDREGRLDEAREWLREAEEQGRKSLTEIRRTVGLLGADESAKAPPMPTATDLPTLVQEFRNAGLDATMSIKGDIESLPEATGLNLYRIVQESLTNVAKHAPGAIARVDLEIGHDSIFLCVHNTNGNGKATIPSDGGGRGVRGIMERAALLGGEMAIDDTDGWTVVVTAPLQK